MLWSRHVNVSSKSSWETEFAYRSSDIVPPDVNFSAKVRGENDVTNTQNSDSPLKFAKQLTSRNTKSRDVCFFTSFYLYR